MICKNCKMTLYKQGNIWRDYLSPSIFNGACGVSAILHEPEWDPFDILRAREELLDIATRQQL